MNNQKSCFVIMPFSKRYDGIFQTIIKPVVEELGHKCFRGDDVFAPSSILEDIFRSINEADFLIADISEHNPNVYYELGFSHGKGKSIILLSQDMSLIPFDLRHQRIISYTDTAMGAVRLKQMLTNFINNIA